MRNSTKIPILLSLVLVLFVRCSDKDAYFQRPSWLEPPIYEVLENQGKFTNYLKCVDRSVYAATLKSGGLQTVFAPNDEAFKQFLASKNFATTTDIPDTLVNKIVGYSIINNNYLFEHLADVLKGTSIDNWTPLSSVKKKTKYYETIHQEMYKGNPIWCFNSASFVSGEQNNKYIPLYLSSMFEQSRTTAQAAEDFASLYPTTYTGKNVQSASIVKSDIIAENGVIHEIDRVLEPLPTIEDLLKDNNYSTFNSLINKTGATGEPYFVGYVYDKTLTDYFQEAFPKKNISNVYRKFYSLAANINNEKTGATDVELGGYTLFAPSNAAITKFENDKLNGYYPNIQSVSPEVLSYFINSQMVAEPVWPLSYKGTINSTGEFLNGKGATGEAFNKANYIKIAPASNGFFYGSDNYIKSRYFETVYTEILLNPNYNLLNTAFNEYFNETLKEEILKCELNGYTQENYTVLMPTNAQLTADGFSWTWIAGSNKFGFVNTQTGTSLGNFDAAARMQRLVKSHIFKRLKNNDVNCAITQFTTDPSFSSAYSGYSYAVNAYGDMIRYKGNQIQSLGNADENNWVTATPYKTFMNGQVFTIDKMLQYSRRTTYPNGPEGYKSQDLLVYIKNMATTAQNKDVTDFVNYLLACLTSTGSNDIAGLSADMFLTMFMPNNAAMAKARTNNDLPYGPNNTNCNLPTLAEINATGGEAKKAIATKFVLYHILKGPSKLYVDDGLNYIVPNNEVIKEEVIPTVYKDIVDITYLAVRKDNNGVLTVSTQSQTSGSNLSMNVNSFNVVRGITHSNFLGSNAVMHEINGYLTYKKVQ
jgi:uncharacterized surface protein with fasciclin (FAS1) repeats